MKTLSAAVLAAIAADAVAVVQLVRLQFASGDVLLNTSTWDLDWGGLTYQGAYGLGAIGAINDRPGEAQRLTLTLSGADSTRIALALDASDEVQGAIATLRTAIISTSTYQVLDAPIEWLGKCDTMSISEDGATASVAVTVESNDIDLLRSNVSTYSHNDQIALYPDDLAFQYVVAQVDQPVVWPAREYFYK